MSILVPLRLDPDEFAIANGERHDDEHRYLGRALYKRAHILQPPLAAGTTFTSIGFPAITAAGTAASHDNANFGQMIQYTSATTLDADAGIINNVFTNWRPSQGLEFEQQVQLGTNFTDGRHWIGLFSATPMAAAASAIYGAAFRYDTKSSADATAFWRCWTNDSGADTGTQTILTAASANGEAAIVADQSYELRIRIATKRGSNPHKVTFWINEQLVATHTSNLPAGTALNLGVCAQVRHATSGGSAHVLRLGQTKVLAGPIAM